MKSRLPSQLLLIALQVGTLVWAQASLIPPSTFGGETSFSISSTSSNGSNSTRTAPTPTNSADFPSLSGYSSCVTTCLSMGVASANCSSITDVNCFCTRRRFGTELVDCISANCSNELATAESLSQQFCNLGSNSTSLSFPSQTVISTSTLPPPTTNSNNSFSTTTATSTTSQSLPTTNAASQFIRGPEASAFYTLCVISLIAILGPHLVK